MSDRPSRQERALRRYLRALVEAVEYHIRELDGEMKRPSDVERGKRIARLTNALEIRKDEARFYALNIDPLTGKLRSRQATKRAKAVADK